MPKRRVEVACLQCGTINERRPWQVERGHGKFCDLACFNAYRTAAQAEKVCRTCGEEKAADQFDRNYQQAKRLRPECRECRRARSRAYYARTRAERREVALRSQFGIGSAEYDRMHAAQEGRCAVCGTTEPGNGFARLVIDHCHASGRVRALLCAACNAGLGAFRDRPDLLRRAAAYLERNGDDQDRDAPTDRLADHSDRRGLGSIEGGGPGEPDAQ